MKSINQVSYIKISPGIGMARVGNSPEYFIGPETFGEVPNPGDHKYKDAQGRIKRQAARFRVFGYDKDDNLVMEIKHDPANGISVTWEVDVVNSKAANYAFQGKYAFDPTRFRNPGVKGDKRKALVIDPGPQTISGINQKSGAGAKDLEGSIFEGIGKAEIPCSLISPGKKSKALVTYKSKNVNIGRLETDPDGRLIFIGGAGDAGCLTEPPTFIAKGVGYFGPNKTDKNTNPSSNGNSYFNNPGWYDDTCGGAINATVHYTPQGGSAKTFSTRPDATKQPWGDPHKRAWVGVGPPKYVPQMNNVVSLLDLQINMFPEADPYSGSFNYIFANPAHTLEIATTNTPSDLKFAPISAVTTTVVGAPSAVSFAGKFYLAYTSNAENYLAASSDGKTFAAPVKIGSQATTVGPAITAFNGKLIYVVTGTDKKLYMSTSSDGKTFTPFTEVAAQSGGLLAATPPTLVSPSLAAYNGYLYLALTDTDNNHYLATQPQGSNDPIFLFSKVGQADVLGSTLSPSIHYFDGDLYYAFTGKDLKCYLAKWNNFRKSSNSKPAPNTFFDFKFTAFGGTAITKQGPCITSYNGKFYYALKGTHGYVYLATGSPGFTSLNFDRTLQESSDAAPAIAAFETVSFYRDVYPVLRTVTEYAWVNMPAYSGHRPFKNGDFLKGLVVDGEQKDVGLASPDYENNVFRLRVFQVLRQPSQLTPTLPPPPITTTNLPVFVSDREPMGTLMPHLVGDGGSRGENKFNDTNFPNQWLSLTRHQLDKFQLWVNGAFLSKADSLTLPTPQSLDFAALEPTVGGGFHPGIELTYYMELPNYFAAPFRFADEIKHNGTTIDRMAPGTVSGYMSVPWHGDFWSCSGDFWAAQRPDIVVTTEPGPVGGYEFHTKDWFRGTGIGIPPDADSLSDYLVLGKTNPYGNTGYEVMAQYWTQFGFVVKTDNLIGGQVEMIETERAACLDSDSSPCLPDFPTPNFEQECPSSGTATEGSNEEVNTGSSTKSPSPTPMGFMQKIMAMMRRMFGGK